MADPTTQASAYTGPIGACQSCRHALASLPGEDNQPVPHDGRDPRGRCGLPSHSLATFVAHAEPRMDLPVNACWEPRRG
jgi:hypothetical protein